MEVNKEQWPEGTTVTTEGFFSPSGELLNSEPHTQAFVDEWNGVKPKPKKTDVSLAVSILYPNMFRINFRKKAFNGG